MSSARRKSTVACLLALFASALTSQLLLPSAAAVANSECLVLDSSALAFDAPALTAEPGATSCWTLPSQQGDVLQAGAGDAYDDGAVDVVDANGSTQCQRIDGSSSRRCTLDGPAPYTLTFTPTWNSSTHLRVARLNAAQGCAALSSASFGAITTTVIDVSQRPFACAAGDLSEGGVLVLGGRRWALYDDAGRLVCAESTSCQVMRPGPHALVVTPDRGGPYGQVSLSVTPLGASTSGCDQSMSVSWDVAAEQVTTTGPLQVNCRVLTGVASGQRLLAESQGGVETSVVDAHGTAACPQVPDRLGCETTGDGPYRLLSWLPDYGSSYRLAARDLSGWAGCPTVTATPFGIGSGAPTTGGGCRRLDPGVSGPHVAQAGGVTKLYDASGLLVCQTSICHLEADRDYFLVTSALSALPTAFHELFGQGCVDNSGRVDDTWRQTLPAGAWGCGLLPLPEGAIMTSLGYGASELIYVDATGADICHDVGHAPCQLSGQGPFRMLVRSPENVGSDAAVVLSRLDAPEGCAPLPAGTWGTTDGARISLAEGQIAGCLTVPGDSVGAAELFAFQRATGTSGGRMIIRDADPGECRTGESDHNSIVCRRLEGAVGPLSVFVTSDGTPSTWDVVRHPVGDTTGCADLPTVDPGAPGTPGALDGFLDMDCFRLAGDPQRYDLDVHGLDQEVSADVYGVGKWWPTCRLGWLPCLLGGYDEYQVIVRSRGFAPNGGEYRLEAPRIWTGTDPSPACRPYQPREPEATFEATLDDDHPTVCVLLEDSDSIGASYRIELTSPDGSPVQLEPEVVRAANGGGSCTWQEAGVFECSYLSSTVNGEKVPFGALLLSRPDGVGSLSFTAHVTCAAYHRCVAPTLTAQQPPVVTGTARVDESLSATTGYWGWQTLSYAYQWYADGQPIPGATAATLKLTAALRGRSVLAEVTAHADNFYDGTSRSTAVVIGTGTAPVATTAPRVKGQPVAGSRVYAGVGTWNKPASSYQFQWYVAGQRLATTSRALLLRPWMAGKRVKVTVIAVRPGCYRGSAVSPAVLVRR